MGAQPMPMHPGSGYSGPVQNDHVMQQNDDPYLEMGADGMMDPQALEEDVHQARQGLDGPADPRLSSWASAAGVRGSAPLATGGSGETSSPPTVLTRYPSRTPSRNA